jgi:flagellar biosynthesis/type III secretory pathway protein FliH
MDEGCGSDLSDRLTRLHIEIPDFSKAESELETNLDKWLYALKNMPELDRQPGKLSGPIFDRLFREAEIADFTEDELWCYEQSLKACRDAYSVLETHVEMGFKKGFKEGFEKGFKEEFEKEFKKGIKEGVGIAKSVRTCYRNGLPIEQIEIFFGLSRDKILKIIGSGKPLSN